MLTVPILPSMKGLQALSALAEAGSLTAAADKLGVTRSALSHRIADLEKQLGIVLLRQAGRGVALTSDAETLIAAMGDALDRIESAIAPLRRRRMQVRLSTVATFASHWLIPRLPEFHARHPDIEIAISTTTRTVDLRHEDFDCAIRHGRGRWTGLAATLLFRETLMPVTAPAISDRPAARRRDIFASAPLIYARSRYRDWSVWWKRVGRQGKPPEPGLLVETRAQALEAALAGSGIAMIDMAYIRQHVTEGRLRMLAESPIELSEGYYFVHRETGRNQRMVKALGNWLVETAKT